MNQKAKLGVSGAAAGLVNGLFGGGGGMVMAPLLTGWCGYSARPSCAAAVTAAAVAGGDGTAATGAAGSKAYEHTLSG